MNNIELSNMPHDKWVEYKRENRSVLLNSYPEYDFGARLEVIKKFKEILEQENIRLFLSGGALLGCYREKDFIPWDHDVDMDVFAEELAPKFDIVKSKLIDMGYIVRGIKEYPNMKINVYCSGEKIGIIALYLDSDKKKRYRYVHSWPADLYVQSEKVIFKGISFEAPSALRYIEHTYGKNWKTPMKKNYLSKDLFR
mgnify:CR=1 FL=1